MMILLYRELTSNCDSDSSRCLESFKTFGKTGFLKSPLTQRALRILRIRVFVTALTLTRRYQVFVIGGRCDAVVYSIDVHGNGQQPVNVLPLDRASEILVVQEELPADIFGTDVLLNVLNFSLAFTALTALVSGIVGTFRRTGFFRTFPLSIYSNDVPDITDSDVLFLESGKGDFKNQSSTGISDVSQWVLGGSLLSERVVKNLLSVSDKRFKREMRCWSVVLSIP